jgi:ribonuclease E
MTDSKGSGAPADIQAPSGNAAEKKAAGAARPSTRAAAAARTPKKKASPGEKQADLPAGEAPSPAKTKGGGALAAKKAVAGKAAAEAIPLPVGPSAGGEGSVAPAARGGSRGRAGKSQSAAAEAAEAGGAAARTRPSSRKTTARKAPAKAAPAGPVLELWPDAPASSGIGEDLPQLETAVPSGSGIPGRQTAPEVWAAPETPLASDILEEEAIVSSLPPFYAPHRDLFSAPESAPAPAEAAETPSPEDAAGRDSLASSLPPFYAPHRDLSPDPEAAPGGPEPAEPEGLSAEDAAGLETLQESGAGEEDTSEGEDGKTEKKRRTRGRRGRGRKKNEGQALVAALPQVEGSDSAALVPDAGFHAREALVGDGPLAGEEELVQALDLGKKPGRGRNAGARSREEEEAGTAASGLKGRRKMFVSVLAGEQVEVVIAEEGQVCEYYVEMIHQAKTKGNIYKAVIHNVDPNLQAAFVNYGAVKNGFLQIDEVHPEYFHVAHDPAKGHKYPPIQKVLKVGQELLVQVVKEPSGTKGAFLSTYLSLPGRFLVLTPGREQIGVSRKVEQEDERSRLRDLLEGLNPGPGLGVIVRTVSMGAGKTNLQRDLQYLKRLWKDLRRRGTEEKPPCRIYQEMDLTTRAVRDYLTDDIAEVWIDDEGTFAALTELAEALFPRKQGLVNLHKDGGQSLLERFNLQRQLDQIHSREVSLPSGGRLVIDPTEALTAIDINSGRSGGKSNFEDMAYRTNLEAARMIPLQLRLRDIGGQVVVDFIEMHDKSHWREVEKVLRAGMKDDRARFDVGKIGPFGMLEIVRQRLGSSAISISTELCPHCGGAGVRRNIEWRSQKAMRDIHKELRAAQAGGQTEFLYAADPDLALHLLNHKRERLLEMENDSGLRLEIILKRRDE